MHEVGAERQTILGFLQKVRELGVEKALDTSSIPEPARRFTQTTFCIINEDKPHLAAAALAFGRETIIPDMFRRFLQQMDISATQAPNFHDYLNRHVHLDENFHGPMSLKMLESLCGDAEKADNAEAAAEEAICARIRLWDGVHEAIKQNR
jgi:pyrroloquinoline quinone (PQQ) biosynthesis protein C